MEIKKFDSFVETLENVNYSESLQTKNCEIRMEPPAFVEKVEIMAFLRSRQTIKKHCCCFHP